MTLAELSARLPPGFKAEITQYAAFWRCTIMNDWGQPKGIGEAQTPEDACNRAFGSFSAESGR